jgi:hypothetical protein
VLATELARSGKRVLLVDLDLESPGLSALLLPAVNLPEAGIVDWFIASALGAEDQILDKLLALSPVSEALDGEIRVASAKGSNDRDYLAKLVRIYSEVPTKGGTGRLSDKIVKLIESLEAKEKPDFVLIDSRGGLHELAAVALGRLADIGLLFCQNSQQSWDGYKTLFDHWSSRPQVSRVIRERLKMVYALFPESRQADELSAFRERSWDLFRERLYDEVSPEDSSGGLDLFSFDESDTDAPHTPLVVRWNPRLVEYDPRVREDEGGLSSLDIDLTFGPFIKGVLVLAESQGSDDGT